MSSVKLGVMGVLYEAGLGIPLRLTVIKDYANTIDQTMAVGFEREEQTQTIVTTSCVRVSHHSIMTMNDLLRVRCYE